MRFITAVLLTLTACPLWAQTQIDQPPTGRPEGRIVGVVTNDDGEPVAGAIPCTEIADPNGTTRKLKTVNLTPELPTARVVLKIGQKPAELIVNVTDRQTGKPVETFYVRWMADTASACSGNGNFMRAGTSGVRVPIRAATDVIVEVSAVGYKSWFFSDPSDPTRPVLRLESGEEKTLNAELVPDAAHSQPTQ